MGAVDPYRLGKVRAFVIEKIAPRDFSVSDIENIRLAYDGDDELFEALFQEWMKDHLEYLKWYASVILDPNVPLEVLLKPPQVCLNPRRSAREISMYATGFYFKPGRGIENLPLLL